MTLSPGRIVGVALGAVAILAIGVYGPAMLLGPLPEATIRVDAASAATGGPGAPVVLPDAGASALAIVGDDGTAETLAVGGAVGAVPIGGAAKLIAVLATLDSLPLPASGPGPAITIGPSDYTNYLDHVKDGNRTLQVSPGDSWTERDVVRATLLASSNNHADTLVRWAFGSAETYVVEANAWLEANGFDATRVADATGLSADNVGTAEELARLGALLYADPALTAIVTAPGATDSTARGVPDVIDHLREAGVRALSRSYTDQAGVCFIFSTVLPSADGGEPTRVTGAMTMMPDYETLDPAVTEAVTSVTAAAQPVMVITEGDEYGTVTTAWGDSAALIARTGRTDAAWGSDPGEASVAVEPFSTATAGRAVGTVTVPTADGDIRSELELSADIDDPGPLWRLTNPAPLIAAFFAAQPS
ncbi:serine hydrolase [Agromyces italicus]|uniref:serine hydrolase n=1 Tax=Agromyces italicus TaxID=279572 RepID=UPI0003B66D1F|nr:serine hydrolase [Agromyces italicus]